MRAVAVADRSWPILLKNVIGVPSFSETLGIQDSV
jgi:hypothetical protein